MFRLLLQVRVLIRIRVFVRVFVRVPELDAAPKVCAFTTALRVRVADVLERNELSRSVNKSTTKR